MLQKQPWDQRFAGVLVKPLIGTPVSPNQLTFVTLLLALAGAGLFVPGDPLLANYGAGIFVLARFFDHCDGELARQSDQTSKLGYYLDYVSGALSYAALFVCLGIGLRDSFLGNWAVALGAAGAASALISMFVNLGIDKLKRLENGDTVGYPSFAGFELEDGIYLLAPIVWVGFSLPFFVLAGAGAAVYMLWTLALLLRLGHR
ncbi:MAG: CDP-alcohol phosphatidyltransferase [Rhodospirillaceae bacterium]|nr:CDP-alcohol phosphatidyltransferase [Rhodospirillaceae bacterium]